MIKNSLLFILIIICGSSFYGQTTVLNVSSPDSIGFHLYVEDVLINDTLAFSLTSDINKYRNVKLSSKLNIDSAVNAEIKVDLVKGHINSYDLMRVGSKYIFTFSNVTPNSIPIDVDSVTIENTNAVRTLDAVVDAEPIEVDVIPSKMGCDKPLDAISFSNIYEDINSEVFQSQREMQIQELFASRCFSTAQIIKLLDLIEFEDKRLQLLKLVYPNTYDQDKYNELTSLLYFERNINTLNEFLENR